MKLKKYKNRKLYNMETASYVTLKDVATCVRKGGTVQVFDYATKNDITIDILRQCVATCTRMTREQLLALITNN